VSQENVEIVRRGFLATSRGDPTAVEYDPLAEWDMTGVVGWAEKDVYRGSEILPFLRAWANSWRDWRFDVEDVLAGQGQQVFVAIREWGTGVESDASVDQRRYFAVTVDRGRIMRVRMFSERADALKAVALEE
jgi:ketosteroid isomerase-like protein